MTKIDKLLLVIAFGIVFVAPQGIQAQERPILKPNAPEAFGPLRPYGSEPEDFLPEYLTWETCILATESYGFFTPSCEECGHKRIEGVKDWTWGNAGEYDTATIEELHTEDGRLFYLLHGEELNLQFSDGSWSGHIEHACAWDPRRGVAVLVHVDGKAVADFTD